MPCPLVQINHTVKIHMEKSFKRFFLVSPDICRETFNKNPLPSYCSDLGSYILRIFTFVSFGLDSSKKASLFTLHFIVVNKMRFHTTHCLRGLCRNNCFCVSNHMLMHVFKSGPEWPA